MPPQVKAWIATATPLVAMLGDAGQPQNTAPRFDAAPRPGEAIQNKTPQCSSTVEHRKATAWHAPALRRPANHRHRIANRREATL